MPATATNMDLLRIALKAAEMAEENILKYFRRDLSIEWKASRVISRISSSLFCR